MTLLAPCWQKLLEKAFLGQLEKLKDGLESRSYCVATVSFVNLIKGAGHIEEYSYPQEMHALAFRGELNCYLQLNFEAFQEKSVYTLHVCRENK